MDPSPVPSPDLLDLARSGAAAACAAGRLGEDLIAAIGAAGLWKMYLPAELGGMALSLPAACATIAALAEADAAAGWALMIGAGPNWFAGVMPTALAEEVFARSSGCVAGSGTPGSAVAQAGGFAISGRWPWCSGAPWADWFTFAVQIEGLEAAAMAVAVPAAQVHADPGSWQVRGLAATASQDATLDGAVVPSHHLFRLDVPPVRHEPIFAVPFRSFAEATMAAVAVGVARRLVDEFADLARRKRSTSMTGSLAEQPLARDQFARGAALLRAAELWWTVSVQRCWDDVVGRAPTATSAAESQSVTQLQLASVHAVAAVAEVADRLRPLTGMSTLSEASTLGRLMADSHAIGHNAVVASARFADAGAALLATR